MCTSVWRRHLAGFRIWSSWSKAKGDFDAHALFCSAMTSDRSTPVIPLCKLRLESLPALRERCVGLFRRYHPSSNGIVLHQLTRYLSSGAMSSIASSRSPCFQNLAFNGPSTLPDGSDCIYTTRAALNQGDPNLRVRAAQNNALLV